MEKTDECIDFIVFKTLFVILKYFENYPNVYKIIQMFIIIIQLFIEIIQLFM